VSSFSESLSDAEIQSIVEVVFAASDENDSFNKLSWIIDNRAVPLLIAALSDPRTAARVPKRGKYLDYGSPFGRICSLLGRINPLEAVPALTGYLDHPEAGFRECAARKLAGFALTDCAAPVSKALTGVDDGVRRSALNGLFGAVCRARMAAVHGAKHGDAEFFRVIFPALAQLLQWPGMDGYVPSLLAWIDFERALQLFLAPSCLSLDNPQLEYVLEELNCARHPIPHELLLPLIEHLEPRANEYKRASQLGQALIAYGIHPDADAERKFRTLLASSSEEVAARAAEGLAAMKGLGDRVGFEVSRGTA
jgi:HEAT repeat protein